MGGQWCYTKIKVNLRRCLGDGRCAGDLHRDAAYFKALLWRGEREDLVLMRQIDPEVHRFHGGLIVKGSGREVVIVDLTTGLPEEGNEAVDGANIRPGGEVDAPLIGLAVAINVPGQLETVFNQLIPSCWRFFWIKADFSKHVLVVEKDLVTHGKRHSPLFAIDGDGIEGNLIVIGKIDLWVHKFPNRDESSSGYHQRWPELVH